MRKLSIHLGALAPPLSEQLAGLADPDTLAHFDRDAEAIARLAVRGLLTGAEKEAAYKRLVKAITKAAAKWGARA